MNSVYVVTLGCSKNEVDTSVMLSVLDKEKFMIASSLADADFIIVNTCGFIDSAKEESIDTIMEVSQLKTEGNCKKLFLAGCLAQRYPEELMSEIPEIDGIIGTGNLKDINEILTDALSDVKTIKIDNLNDEYLENYKRLNVHTTEYVKISEGCNNNCAYCIIPKLRGKNRSRKIEDIKIEIEDLVERGTKEVILIAQNTSDYGIDLYGEYRLAELIEEISTIEKLKWIRVLYLYPDHFNDRLIQQFKTNEKLVKYVDIPLQHVNNAVLQRMNRHTNKKHIVELVNTLRKEIPEIVLRTTFIVGFPGETEEEFTELTKFIQDYPFDKLGVFPYSLEEGTRAYQMENQISEEVKQNRVEQIMELQNTISEQLLQKKIGQKMDILIEEELAPFEYSGRSYMDSPEIDGVCYVSSKTALTIGEFYPVEIVGTLEYDMLGDII